MQAKEFMAQVQRAEKELVSISAKRRHYLDLMMSIGVKAITSDKVSTQPSGSSKTETAAIGLIEMESQLAEKEREYTALVKKAEALIAKLSQEKFRQVLTFRYLCDWSWRSIRDELGYKDEKSVYRCHGFALKELQKVM